MKTENELSGKPQRNYGYKLQSEHFERAKKDLENIIDKNNLFVYDRDSWCSPPLEQQRKKVSFIFFKIFTE